MVYDAPGPRSRVDTDPVTGRGREFMFVWQSLSPRRRRNEGDHARQLDRNVQVHRDGAQIRRWRVHRRSVVRRPVLGDPGRAVPVTVPRRCLLRHTRARSGPAPDHVAAQDGWPGRGLASEVARRSRHPHRGPRAARRRRTGRAAGSGGSSRRGARDRPGPPAGTGGPHQHREECRVALRARWRPGGRVLRRRGDGQYRRRRRTDLARVGTRADRRRWPRTPRALEPPAAGRRGGPGRARFETGASARPGGRRGLPQPRRATPCTGRWPTTSGN